MMVRVLWLSFVSLSITLGVAACATTGEATEGQQASDTVLPIFEAVDIQGDDFVMADHLGSDVVVMSFWATYCEPCKAEMPVLQKLHTDYASQGLKLVSISLDGPETMAGVKPYIRKNRYGFQVLIDEDTSIAQAYNPRGAAPYMLIIGRDGKVHKRVEGFQASEIPEIEAEVRRLLGLAAH